jgi:apolipoprotein D and lipocalin family protein
LDRAPDYSYAVIGEPNREYLWVLGRSPVMKDGKLDKILDRVKMQGYRVDGLIRTAHTRSGQ